MNFLIGTLIFMGGAFFGVVVMCIMQVAGSDEK